MIRLEASFSRLSPSMMAESRRGTLILCKTEVADTASGGDTIPPSKKPSAIVQPGNTVLDTTATTSEVRMTIRQAKLLMTRLHRHSSFQDVYQAASYSSGGRKT